MRWHCRQQGSWLLRRAIPCFTCTVSARTGKSHLLQAICAAVPGSAYLPLAQLLDHGTECWMAQRSCLSSRWMTWIASRAMPSGSSRLFGLYNDCLANGVRLVVAATVPAMHLDIGLPDLRSRLAAMPQIALRALDETQQREALRLRAAQRGIDLPEETVLYLQRRFVRDMARLHELLDRLDLASLQQQRRLTVPFIPGDPWRGRLEGVRNARHPFVPAPGPGRASCSLSLPSSAADDTWDAP